MNQKKNKTKTLFIYVCIDVDISMYVYRKAVRTLQMCGVKGKHTHMKFYSFISSHGQGGP